VPRSTHASGSTNDPERSLTWSGSGSAAPATWACEAAVSSQNPPGSSALATYAAQSGSWPAKQKAQSPQGT
jgi:hypothetical protein